MLGDHGARLQNIESVVQKTSSDVIDLKNNLGDQVSKVDHDLSRMQEKLDLATTSPSDVITELGLAEPDEVFAAMVYKGGLWVFPATASLSNRLKAAGFQREQVNEALYGFKVKSLETTGGTSLPQ